MQGKFVFDSSSIISVSDTCLIDLLEDLKDRLGVEFYIPKSVEYESVERPLKIKRFELNAIRIKKAIDEKWIKVMDLKGKFKEFSVEIGALANNSFYSNAGPVRIIQEGEIETLALIKQLNASALVIDERTTRMLVEAPYALRGNIQYRHKTKISINRRNLDEFRKHFEDLNIIRSSELLAMAYEEGLFKKDLIQSKQALEAALYAVKFNGCSLSGEEIKAFLRSVR